MFYFCSMKAELSQLAEMRQVAFDLGMVFGRAAQAEDDLDRKLALMDAYLRSFASVRLSIALKMRLEREVGRPAAVEARPEAPETERPETERPEPLERPERYDERDRDRDTERVSLPILLRTLSHVADDAERLTPQAAELPTLRELLDRVKAPAEPRPAAVPRPAAGVLRARLTGSTTTLTLTPPPPRPLGPLPRTGPPRPTGPPGR